MAIYCLSSSTTVTWLCILSGLCFSSAVSKQLIFKAIKMADQTKQQKLNLVNKERNLWIVKVPKYVADKWENASDNENVASIRITKTGNGRSDFSLVMPASMANNGEHTIPKIHKIKVSALDQTMGVFTQKKNEQFEQVDFKGRINRRLDCMPNYDITYRNFKENTIREASKPKHTTIKLDHVERSFKPQSCKQVRQERIMRKNKEINCKSDKNLVVEMLFSLFKKQQFYTFHVLHRETKQPLLYLKGILREYCNYNIQSPNQGMWELKPEYRHCNKDHQEINNESFGLNISDFDSD